MSTEFRIDFGAFDEQFDRVSHWPNARTLIRLESALTDQFQVTQRDVHVITESLRRSGRVNSSIDHSSWTGEIRYGGLSPSSVHDPVKYARYELNRQATRPGVTIRGAVTPDHDFMRGTRAQRFHRRYVQAILAHLRGEA